MNIVKSKSRHFLAVAAIPMAILTLGARATFPAPFGFRGTIIAANAEGQVNYVGDYDDPRSRDYVDGENQVEPPQTYDQDVQVPASNDDSYMGEPPPNFNPFENYDELPSGDRSQDENNQLEPPQNYDPRVQAPSLNDDPTSMSPPQGGYVPVDPRGIVIRPGSRSPILPSSPLLMAPPGSAAMPNVWPR
jgi:hypothetical protein